MSTTSKGSKLPRSSWSKRLVEFRFLGVILGVWVLLGLYEMTRTDLPRSPAEVPPDWLLDDNVNLSRTLMELYPDRSLGYFLRSYQAGMCYELGYQPPVCHSFKYKDTRDAQEALERAIAQGGLSNQEELFHFYSVILLRNGEPPEKVNAAIAAWRRNYPYSTKKPDPR